MRTRAAGILVTVLSVLVLSLPANVARGYENFKVSVYCRAYETREMNDVKWIEPRWTELSRQVHVDKVYLETHRDLIVVDEATLLVAKKFFADRGVQTAGGITLTVNERNRFETFCYTNPEHRRKVQEIVEYTARHFDEVILDDFFFTNCKCELCIAAKGDKSWTEYRLGLLAAAARDLIVGPAKAVNPKVKVVVKYPNWYEHFQGLGFNLEAEPALFDGLYTGTETRDPSGNQHLQQYLGYLIFRYFDNLKPGHNGGGWVDTGGMTYMDRYAEQLWLTLFAKAPEITLFDIRQVQRPLPQSSDVAWRGQQTSFDFDEMIKPVKQADGTTVAPTTIARAAGYTFEKVDEFLGKLGKPVGVKSYKPYHSTGEDFLHNYLGMCGIPMDLVPQFPAGEKMILLTECAKFDPTIVAKIKGQLRRRQVGRHHLGPAAGLAGQGHRGHRRAAVHRPQGRRQGVRRRLRPPDAGEGRNGDPPDPVPDERRLGRAVGLNETNGWPMLISAGYAKGTLYVLTIPESFTDLYNLPAGVLSRIKDTLTRELPVRVDGPGKVSLFVYDNGTFIVESFLDEPVDVGVTVARQAAGLHDVLSDEVLAPARGGAGGPRMGGFGGRGPNAGPRTTFTVPLKPHSYRVFQCR